MAIGNDEAPRVLVTVPDLTPRDTSARGTLTPQLTVSAATPPVPETEATKTTEAPSVTIRSITDLAPIIVGKKD